MKFTTNQKIVMLKALDKEFESNNCFQLTEEEERYFDDMISTIKMFLEEFNIESIKEIIPNIYMFKHLFVETKVNK